MRQAIEEYCRGLGLTKVRELFKNRHWHTDLDRQVVQEWIATTEKDESEAIQRQTLQVAKETKDIAIGTKRLALLGIIVTATLSLLGIALTFFSHSQR